MITHTIQLTEPHNYDPENLRKIQELTEKIVYNVSNWCTLKEELKKLGSILFKILIQPNENQYRQILTEIKRLHQQNTRAKLHIQVILKDDMLNSMPWEFLFDPADEMFLSLCDFICISRCRDFVVATEKVHAFPLSLPVPLKVLMVMATPVLAPLPQTDRFEPPCTDTLAYARFLLTLQERYGKELFQYKLLAGVDATPDAVEKELKEGYKVVFFVGHCYVANNESFFVLEDGTSRRFGQKLSFTDLKSWLETSNVTLVVFSTCDSFRAALTLSTMNHLEAVIGMQMELPMISATAFDRTLLEALIVWQAVPEAVMEARLNMKRLLDAQLTNKATWQAIDRPDWGIPVLFYRPKDEHRNCFSFPEGEYMVGISEEEICQLGYKPSNHIKNLLLKFPLRRVLLKAFQINCRPVTNHQYQYFLNKMAPDFALPPGFERHQGVVSIASLNPLNPVVNISYKEAEAYCRWAGGNLPSPDEWEVAIKNANVQHSNILEWTRNDIKIQTQKQKVVVGYHKDLPEPFRIEGVRVFRNPDLRYPNVGFRCVFDCS
ncbi:MAG: CHAT domain-containing protein [Methanobacteriota archaeon]|nr:MAG: CHAT domain-containing protein [Euryarchaeota archaeon]